MNRNDLCRLDSADSVRFARRPLLAFLVLAVAPLSAFAQWPQWGGPNRDFSVEAKGLAQTWPSDGPKKLWSRPLGPGNSSIIVDDGRLYTMYRNGDDDVVVAMNGADGKTVWERKYAAPIPKGLQTTGGKGPHATPAVGGDFIYTVGIAGQLHCLRKKDGEIVWSKNFLTDVKGKAPLYGFASTPIVYKDRLIAAVGGVGAGVAAFDLKSGSVIWQKHDFGDVGMGLYASPIIANILGEDHLIVMSETEVVGLDPVSGEIRWSHPHANQGKINVPTPLWGADGVLFASSGGEGGTRALKFEKSDGKIKPKELWVAEKSGRSIGNLVRSGDYLYGSSDTGMGPAFFTGINVKDGKVLWTERGFSKSSVLAPDGKLLILDEDGNLALAVPSPEKLEVKSKVKLLRKPVWTPPTLVGQKLYLRDSEVIMALDLGAAGK